MSLTRRKLLLVVMAAILVAPAVGDGARADALTDGAKKFIQTMSDEAIRGLTGTELTSAQRKSKFREIFQGHFDVPAIGKWVLGRYWRKASTDERRTYLAAFEDFVVNTYANRFKEYSNEKFEVISAEKRDGNAIVHSQIIRENGQPPVRITWKLVAPNSQYRITDIVVEGVSMAQTQRSEFGSVIRRSGGQVAGLIDALQKKNAALEAE